MVRRAVGIIILVAYLLAVVLQAPESTRWLIAIGAVLVVIIDYYWFSGRRFDSDEE